MTAHRIPLESNHAMSARCHAQRIVRKSCRRIKHDKALFLLSTLASIIIV